MIIKDHNFIEIEKLPHYNCVRYNCIKCNSLLILNLDDHGYFTSYTFWFAHEINKHFDKQLCEDPLYSDVLSCDETIIKNIIEWKIYY